MRSFDRKAGLTIALALAASAAAPQHAFAQFFFRPFANVFRAQIPSEGPPAYASRPAVAAILGRTGFQLVGPLGRRGDQILATGVSRREGEMRFIIDPYEGRILRAVRLGRAPNRGAPYSPPMAGGPAPAGPGFDHAGVPEAAQEGARLNGAPNGPGPQRAAAAKVGASSRASRAITPPKPGVGPAVHADHPASASPAPANAAPESSADAESAKNTKSQAPTPAFSEAKPESASSEPASAPSPAAQAPKAEAEGAAAPQAPAVAEKTSDSSAAAPAAQSPAQPAASAERSAPAKRAAAARAASARRAIVPPKDAGGTTVMAPAASAPPVPGANGSAIAPDDGGKPNAGG
ncbi:MAG: hypothetical protein U1E20_04880 [Methylocystis sp.]|uniref:hypothetical protein n=1 Tax=Methylocystis sp. TaxID=1911079 RepID=UPI00395EEA90